MIRRAVALSVAIAALACQRDPAAPTPGPLATGRWAGDSACLSVTDASCNLTIGCGHGQFPRPTLAAGGTFDVQGTYRIEVGPISIDPAPPARFLGVLVGSRLTITVIPSVASLPTGVYTLAPTTAGTCGIACV